MQKQSKYRCCLISVIALVALPICCLGSSYVFLFGEYYVQEIEIWSTKRKLPEKEVEFERWVDAVSEFTGGTLLDSRGGGVGMHDFDNFYERDNFTNCIIGSLRNAYGSDSDFESVIAMLKATGFTQEREFEQGSRRAYFRNTTLRLEVIYQNSYRTSHPEWQEYQTIYEISFRYGSPSLKECYTPATFGFIPN